MLCDEAVGGKTWNPEAEVEFLVFASDSENAEVVQEAFHHEYDPVIAVRIRRSQEEAAIRDER